MAEYIDSRKVDEHFAIKITEVSISVAAEFSFGSV